MVEYKVIRLWSDRVRIVRDYGEHPGKWPDGIDTKYGRWYLGHEEYWRERVGHLTAAGWEGGLDDEAAYGKWSDGGVEEKADPVVGRPREIEGEPWVGEGISRRTWYRRRGGG